MSEKVIEITDGTFEQEVLKSDVPVFVDFWAPWCGPCRMVSPIVEELAGEFEGKMKFAKVNTDNNQAVANNYNIRAIPTLMIFKDGNVAQVVTGFMPKPSLKSVIESVLE